MTDRFTMAAEVDRPRVLNVVTSPLTLTFLRGQLLYLRDRGFDVTVASPRGKRLDEIAQEQNIATIALPIIRRISPFQDLVSLWHLYWIVHTVRPDITNVGTPKAGLLGGLAAWLNRVPCRIYTLHGLRFETTTGLKRRLLLFMERLACCFAHRIICVSKSVRERAVAARLTAPERTVVFRAGSCAGVNAARFARTPETARQAAELRSKLSIPSQAPVLGFVGRLNRDKGIPELVEAFSRLSEQFPDLRLLLLGRFEDEDPVPSSARRCLETHPHVIFADDRHEWPNSKSSLESAAEESGNDLPVANPAPYYAVMDVCVLPSHREGLPTVVLEAQAAGTPVVGTAATGIVDTIVDGETGILCPVGDPTSLAEAVARLLTEKDLAQKLARNGQERVKREFQPEAVFEALYAEYLRLLRSRNLPSPLAYKKTGRDLEANINA